MIQSNKYCKKCSKDFLTEASFCSFCGRPLFQKIAFEQVDEPKVVPSAEIKKKNALNKDQIRYYTELFPRLKRQCILPFSTEYNPNWDSTELTRNLKKLKVHHKRWSNIFLWIFIGPP